MLITSALFECIPNLLNLIASTEVTGKIHFDQIHTVCEFVIRCAFRSKWIFYFIRICIFFILFLGFFLLLITNYFLGSFNVCVNSVGVIPGVDAIAFLYHLEHYFPPGI